MYQKMAVGIIFLTMITSLSLILNYKNCMISTWSSCILYFQVEVDVQILGDGILGTLNST